MEYFLIIVIFAVIAYFSMISKSKEKEIKSKKDKGSAEILQQIAKEKEIANKKHPFSQFRHDINIDRSSYFNYTVDDFLEKNKNHPAVMPKENFKSVEYSFNGIKCKHYSTQGQNERIEKFGKLLLKDGVVFTFSGFTFYYINGNNNEYLCYYDRFWKNHNDEAIIFPSHFTEQTKDFMNKFISALQDVEKSYNQNKKDEADFATTELLRFKENFKQEMADDGKLILTENDFAGLLEHNQQKIADIDNKYIHQFVKVSNYLKKKKENLQIIFENSFQSNDLDEMRFFEQSIKDQVNSYNLILFHSLNMVSALLSNKMIAFYEIYEEFDKLNIFNSNWENEVNANLHQMNFHLANISYDLTKMLNHMRHMERSIVNSIQNLTYVTQNSYDSLNESVNANLKEIKSSVSTNNLFTAINTYQTYKLRKQIQ